MGPSTTNKACCGIGFSENGSGFNTNSRLFIGTVCNTNPVMFCHSSVNSSTGGDVINYNLSTRLAYINGSTGAWTPVCSKKFKEDI